MINETLITKDLLYALKAGSSPAAAISGVAELDELAPGAIALLGDKMEKWLYSTLLLIFLM
jgi:hypothetical protein